MLSKYKFINVDYSDWDKYFKFKRDVEKEDKLYYNILNLEDGEKYNFVNSFFASPPNYEEKIIKIPQNGLKNITLKILPEFTVFDWCKVIENAENIYTVETCFNYLIDKLNIKAKDRLMFSKWNPPNFNHVNKIFKTNWEYVV